jgi:octopine/nopaline transport system substrate-binding protein
MVSRRFGVMFMPAMIASYFLATSEGMMPSQSCATNSHSILAFLQSSDLAKLPGGEYNFTKDEAGADKAMTALAPSFKGKVVGVQGSTTNLAFAEKYLKGIADLREYKTTEQHDLDLAAGRLDAVVAAHSTFKATIDGPNGKELAIVGPAFAGGILGLGVAIGVRKDDAELKGLFDAAIKDAIADGTVKNLSLKWFKVDLSPKS